jgi:ubiquitin C-terminal hydrolase
MKRFKKGADGHFYKNYSKVRLPLELDLGQILNNPTLPSSYYKSLSDEQLDTYHLPKEINVSPCTKYNLMGMILHEGKLGSGHYTAILKGQEWIECNDLKISKINIEKTLK